MTATTYHLIPTTAAPADRPRIVGGDHRETHATETDECAVCSRQGWVTDWPGMGGLCADPQHHGGLLCDRCAAEHYVAAGTGEDAGYGRIDDRDGDSLTVTWLEQEGSSTTVDAGQVEFFDDESSARARYEELLGA